MKLAVTFALCLAASAASAQLKNVCEFKSGTLRSISTGYIYTNSWDDSYKRVHSDIVWLDQLRDEYQSIIENGEFRYFRVGADYDWIIEITRDEYNQAKWNYTTDGGYPTLASSLPVD